MNDLTIIVLAAVSVAYLGVAGAAARRSGSQDHLARTLAAYALLCFVWALAQLAGLSGWLSFRPPTIAARVPLYGLFILAFWYVHLTWLFLRLPSANRQWWYLGAGWLVVLIIIESDLLLLNEVLLSGRGWLITRTGFLAAALTVGWGLSMARAIVVTARAYRRATQPLHRNRLIYWSLSLGFGVMGAGLLLAGQTAMGNGVVLVATLIAAYAILTHRLPDMRRALVQTASYLIATALVVALYTVGLAAVPSVFRALPTYNPWWLAAALAVILVVVFNPLLALVQRQIRRLVSGAGYDPGRTVGEYSTSVSNILNLDRLATVAIGLIHEAIGIQRGWLFLVDKVQDEAGDQIYSLRGVRGTGDAEPVSGMLAADSAVAEYLSREYGPLTQYDIDLLPRFQGIAAGERAWLSSLGMDVYVPIYSMGKWIGMFALGPKVSRHRYFDDDLALLSTLADQTAVALQNARLVQDLVKLNNDIRQAYTALDHANHQLEHLDRTKSDFINIISHELRTPLTILNGYSQILFEELDTTTNPSYLQMVQGIHSGAMRLHEIIESMLDITKIDSRALVLHANPIFVPPLIRRVAEKLEKPLAERRLTLEMPGMNGLPAIEADPEALEKVFYHLFVNAIKFTPDGGKITVSGRRVTDDSTTVPGDQIEVVVQDTGIGIDPRFQELIFTKFYQTGEVALHSTGKTKFKGGGPGLGLAIARGIVEAHGGRIWAESAGYDEETYPGSRFFVVLPLRQPAPAHEDQEPMPPAGEVAGVSPHAVPGTKPVGEIG